ncbi:MAG: pentapeptide repeat-containing protein [Desulfobaccales bacterium]
MGSVHKVYLNDGSPLTRQEKYVLRQVTAGEIADLRKAFGEAEADRRLRARFLSELLPGGLQGVEIHRRGVRISNAVVDESVDLEDAEVAVIVEFKTCIFQEPVNFRGIIIKKYLSLEGSHFLQAADFYRMQVEVSVFCRNTVFVGPVNFGAVTISGQFAAGRVKFLATNQEANFNRLKVGEGGVRFPGAEFHGPVNFGGAHIQGQFVAQGAKFLAESQEATFNGMQVGRSARFDEAEFHGLADFAGADIKGQFVAQGAKFLAPTHKADFTRLQVGQDAFFQGCDFHGVLSFVLVKITGDFHLEPLLKMGLIRATTFHSDINLHGAEIGGELLADKAQFLGHIANFEAVRVGRSFHASGAIFAGSVYFSEMQVRNNFYIDPFGRMKSFKTLFKGAANFSDVEVQGVFNADQAIFQSESVIFSGLKVGQGAFFIGTIFFGGLVLKEGQLTDLVIRGLHRLSKGGMPLDEIVLNRTRITHRLTIENLEVKRFTARNLEVKGPAELRHLKIKNEADLRDASCHILQIVEVDWPAPRDGGKKTYLDGLAYQSLTTQTEPDQAENWRELLDWLRSSRFNTQNFQEMDAFFQRAGLRKWADKVYIAGKRRELGQFRWWHPGNWLTRFFWGVLAGFGRKPGRAFWPALALVLLGWLVFTPLSINSGAMSPDWLGQFLSAHPTLAGFFVSLDRFLPGVDLGVAKVCQPAALSSWVWFYWQLQKLLGWILAPIVVAAIYTKIK